MCGVIGGRAVGSDDGDSMVGDGVFSVYCNGDNLAG